MFDFILSMVLPSLIVVIILRNYDYVTTKFQLTFDLIGMGVVIILSICKCVRQNKLDKKGNELGSKLVKDNINRKKSDR